MKIVYCLNGLSVLGGRETIICTKADYLSSIGHDVSILLDDHLPINDKLSIDKSVTVLDCGLGYSGIRTHFPWNIPAVLIKKVRHKRMLAGFLRKNKPDIVIFVSGESYVFLPFIKGPWATIREMHSNVDPEAYLGGKGLKGVFTRLKIDLINRKYDRVVVLTQGEKNIYKYQQNISVIPNPIRFHDDYGSAPQPAGTNQVISIGRLEEAKGFHHLIRSARAVVDRYPDVHFVLYGDGPMKEVLLSSVSDYHLDDNFFLKGTVSNIQQELQQSLFLVHTSVCETFSLVVLEAMACGIPVISFDCPFGPREIIDDGVTGYLVPPGDEKTLIERICFLIENPDIRKRMSQSALKKAAQYSIERIMGEWADLFNRLSANKKR